MATNYANKYNEQSRIKHAVARSVWDTVIQSDRNPRLIIDAGSSAQAVAEVIAEQVREIGADAIAEERDFNWLTVLTHNLGAWEALRGLNAGLDLFLCDGRYDRRLNANIDFATIDRMLGDYNPSIVIIGASGLDADGLYCGGVQDERPVKEAIARRKTGTRIILADHTKIGLTDVRRFASLESLTENARCVLLVTDEIDVSDLPGDQAAEYQNTINAFKKAFGKDGVLLVGKKTKAAAKSADRGKKPAAAPKPAERPSVPSIAPAAAAQEPPAKREAV